MYEIHAGEGAFVICLCCCFEERHNTRAPIRRFLSHVEALKRALELQKVTHESITELDMSPTDRCALLEMEPTDAQYAEVAQVLEVVDYVRMLLVKHQVRACVCGGRQGGRGGELECSGTRRACVHRHVGRPSTCRAHTRACFHL